MTDGQRKELRDEMLKLLVEAVIQPLYEALGQVLENQKLIADGQQLLEKSLAERLPDDDEPWRESLSD